MRQIAEKEIKQISSLKFALFKNKKEYIWTFYVDGGEIEEGKTRTHLEALIEARRALRKIIKEFKGLQKSYV